MVDTRTTVVKALSSWLDRLTFEQVDDEPHATFRRMKEVARLLDALVTERDSLHIDNERLRWRHPHVIPDWNDLPQELRSKLVEIGGYHSDGYEAGGDLAVNFYGEIRKAMAIPALGLLRPEGE